ncbi:MAG: hypothetical protein EOP49_19995 [Sphingobacteriales bacterium]|nr:MAG: hypothetical protein EOP49_19995 [Sphingobacteriales bacterium]
MQNLSIAKSQAKYLQTLHLDQIGENKSSIEAFELPEVEEALLSMAAYLKSEAEKNLSDSNAISSGNLIKKITFDKVRFMGGAYQLEVSLPDYYKFINSGVNGLKVKHGSPYSFKNMNVSKAMLNNLRKWVIREGLKARTKPAVVDPTRQEQKGRLVNVLGQGNRRDL